MIDHIQSVRVQRISEVIGQLAETDLRAVTRGVTIYLGIADPTRRRLRRVPRGPKRRKRARPHVA
jgi:hypothetical protein